MLQGAATAFHCKDWLYFNPHGQARDRSLWTRISPSAISASASIPSVNRLSRSQRTQHPAAGNRRRGEHASPSLAARAAATGLPAGTRWCSAMSTSSAPALGAGLYDPGTDTGCSIHRLDSMHMRLAAGADDVPAQPGSTGYTMCMPDSGPLCADAVEYGCDGSNIDWILQFGGRSPSGHGDREIEERSARHVDGWLSEANETPLLFPALHFGGPVSRPPLSMLRPAPPRRAFRSITASATWYARSSTVLAFASRIVTPRWGRCRTCVRLSGGAARSASLRRILGGALGASIQTSEREEAGAAGAAMIAGRLSRHLSLDGRLRPRMGGGRHHRPQNPPA